MAADITQQSNDKQQLAPMLDQVKKNTGASPVASSADTGYWSPEQVTDTQFEGIDLHVATGRQKHGASDEPVQVSDDDDLLQQMKQKLQSEAGRTVDKMRKSIVEPVFGQIEECRHFRRFSLRGLENVQAEWQTGVPDTQSIETVSLPTQGYRFRRHRKSRHRMPAKQILQTTYRPSPLVLGRMGFDSRLLHSIRRLPSFKSPIADRLLGACENATLEEIRQHADSLNVKVSFGDLSNRLTKVVH